jgi:cytidylate kinase
MAVLTIAREYGSGGKEIGRRVADLMGYEYVDRNRILEDMRRKGSYWEEQATYFDENHPTAWERYKWSFRGFVALNQLHILEYALKDRVVIMGRGGNFILKGVPHVLRLRTTAPLAKRIETVMKWEEIDNSENARWLIEKADKEIAGAVYLIYGRSWNDPEQYDLVVDTSGTSQEEIVSRVRTGLEERDKLYTEEAKKLLELKTLAARIKAEIAVNRELFVSSLEVALKEEKLVQFGLIVRGVAYNRGDIDKVRETVKTLSGTIPVEVELEYRMYPRLGHVSFK